MKTWSDENVALLRRLWAEQLSVTQIAVKMQTTRGAIIGKAHRLHLEPRGRGFNSHIRGPRPKRPREHHRVGSVPKTNRVIREPEPELSKAELRRQFEQAWRNTVRS